MEGNPLLNPVGSLPPQVYWRRRALAVLVLVLVAWFAYSMLGPSSGASTKGSQATGSHGATPTGPAAGSSVPAPATTTSSAPTTPVAPAVVPTTAAPTTTTPPTTHPAPTTTAAATPACAATALKVTVATDHTVYAAGVQPHFVMSVTNVGAVACRVDVGTLNRGFVVMSGSDRIWSSNDCVLNSHNVAVFKPKDAVSYAHTWDRQRSSSAGCAAAGTGARPGTYTVRAHLGGLTTPIAVFRLS